MDILDRLWAWNMRRKFFYCPRSVVLYWPSFFLRPRSIMLSEGCRIDSFVKMEGTHNNSDKVLIGRNVHIASFCHVNIGGGILDIGAYSTLAPRVSIITGSNQYIDALVSTVAPEGYQKIKRSITMIGQNVFIQTGAIILPGVSIGSGAVIMAGAVVTKDVPGLAIVAGPKGEIVGWNPTTAAPLMARAFHAEVEHRKRRERREIEEKIILEGERHE